MHLYLSSVSAATSGRHTTAVSVERQATAVGAVNWQSGWMLFNTVPHQTAVLLVSPGHTQYHREAEEKTKRQRVTKRSGEKQVRVREREGL